MKVEYCGYCNNQGYIDCHCGGDICVCGEDERECPMCHGFGNDDDVVSEQKKMTDSHAWDTYKKENEKRVNNRLECIQDAAVLLRRYNLITPFQYATISAKIRKIYQPNERKSP